MSETPGKYVTRNKEPSLDDYVDRLEADVQKLKQIDNHTFGEVFEILTQITQNCGNIAQEILPHLNSSRIENGHH